MAATKRGGGSISSRIVNISSLSILGADRMAAYAAAKGGLAALTRALAVELGPHDITLNAIAAGYIRTERAKASPAIAKASFCKSLASCGPPACGQARRKP
jgi:NAD(P)-dependent dehydrogenase (short-subunit alcohol dehydrogenase family)